MKRKHKSRTLVLGYLERILSEAFSDFSRQLTELVSKEHGVYALYKGNRLYYVGLASNLRRRINHHLRDRHAGKWDHFSLYLVRKADHIKELESLILRIADPKGNVTGGRLRQAQNLQRPLDRKIKAEQEKRRKKIFGDTEKGTFDRKSRKTSTGIKRISTLAKWINSRFKIKAVWKGKMYVARVRSDGTINYNGNIYTSPSLAGRAVVNHACDGWHFWKYQNKNGKLVKLDKLRK